MSRDVFRVWHLFPTSENLRCGCSEKKLILSLILGKSITGIRMKDLRIKWCQFVTTITANSVKPLSEKKKKFFFLIFVLRNEEFSAFIVFRHKINEENTLFWPQELCSVLSQSQPEKFFFSFISLKLKEAKRKQFRTGFVSCPKRNKISN